MSLTSVKDAGGRPRAGMAKMHLGRKRQVRSIAGMTSVPRPQARMMAVVQVARLGLVRWIWVARQLHGFLEWG